VTGFSSIIGQERPKRFLKQVMARDKIPHAYLFSGMPGVGKTTTARALAMALNCMEAQEREGCGRCPQCRRFMGGNYPDFSILEPEGRTIKIEQIRDLNRALAFAPVAGEYRVCVIRAAETMTAEAANAFLKTLEEPPPGNVFVLSATEPLDLLPTIVSRCQRVSFQPLPAGDIAGWLVREKGENPETAAVLARIAGGSLGRALRMRETEFLARREEWLLAIRKIPSLAAQEAVDAALKWTEWGKRQGRSGSGGEAGLLDVMEVWQSWYRDLMLLKVQGPVDLLVNSDFSHQLISAGKNYIIKNLVQCVETLERAERELKRMRNPKLVMADAALRLRRLVGEAEGGGSPGAERR